MVKCISLCCFILVAGVFIPVAAQTRGQSPQYLAEEVYRLTDQCYYFQEYAELAQGGVSYVLATFLARDAIRTRGWVKNHPGPGAAQPCGTPPPQIRLYRFVSDTTVEFLDSAFVQTYSLSLGVGADFDNSGTLKVMFNHACRIEQGQMSPLLCYAFSVFEITKDGRLRNVNVPPNVPERWVNGEPTGRALEPVVSDNLDKTPYPELLAVDDFFEGDPAFRQDDFPKITLIYSWDDTAKVFVQRSGRFPNKFRIPDPSLPLPDSLAMTEVMQRVMSLSAVGDLNDAMQLMETGLMPDRFDRWRTHAPERSAFIDRGRLVEKLRTCIDRYRVP